MYLTSVNSYYDIFVGICMYFTSIKSTFYQYTKFCIYDILSGKHLTSIYMSYDILLFLYLVSI